MAALPRAAMEQWATNALGGLCAGWVLPLGASTVRELREGARPGALRVVWTHRVLEMCWNAALGLDAAATHGKLLAWAGGDGARVAAAHALGWTAAAVARAVGPLPGWGRLAHAHPRMVWALGRLGMVLGHLASLNCTSLEAWARLHALCWGLNPLRSSLAAQAVCWRGTVAAGDTTRAAKWKRTTGDWGGAAGFAAAWFGARLVHAGLGDRTHKICIGLCIFQAVMVFATPRISQGGRGDERRRRRRRPSRRPPSPRPFARLAELLCHGGAVGRRLALAALCATGSEAVRVCGDAVCLGPLGWRPTELAVYGALGSWGGNMMQNVGCTRAMATLGWQTTASLGAAVAMLGAVLAASVAAVPTAFPFLATGGMAATAACVACYTAADHLLVRAWGGASHPTRAPPCDAESVTPVPPGRGAQGPTATRRSCSLSRTRAAPWAGGSRRRRHTRAWRTSPASVPQPRGCACLRSASARRRRACCAWWAPRRIWSWRRR